MNLSSLLPNSSFISARNGFSDPIKCAALIIGISRGNSLISGDAARIDIVAMKKKGREGRRKKRERGKERGSPPNEKSTIKYWYIINCRVLRCLSQLRVSSTSVFRTLTRKKNVVGRHTNGNVRFYEGRRHSLSLGRFIKITSRRSTFRRHQSFLVWLLTR